jgi:eukaryotic-like serine/threonine-protein kinase
MATLLSETYRQLIVEFTSQWSKGGSPSLDVYLQRAQARLAEETLSPDFVLTLIEVDLVNQIYQSSRESNGHTAAARVEDYLHFLQKYCGDVSLPNILIVEEFKARIDAGEAPTIEEYVRRFGRGESLERLLHEVQRSKSDPNATNLGTWSPVAPKNLGQYRIERELGRGGMGVVYEATPMDGGPPVALKTLQNRSGSLTRFKSEFRILSDLSHPNLVRLGELVTTSIEPFFSMEMIEGVSFDKYVRSGFDTAAGKPNLPFNEHRLRDALKQLIEGLQALHHVGCIHRDIKPSNVLVTTTGRVVILDFGLAVESHQSTSEFAGTPYYMAPEQAQAREVSTAVDFYAVGVMLFEALTAERPFTGRGLDELLAQKLAADRPSPQSIVADIPADLHQLCEQLLQANPAARPDAAAILQRLTGGPVSSAGADVWIGRDTELSTLERAWSEVGEGKTRAVLVSGSSGVGKTALVDRFLKELKGQQQVIILRGRCYENEIVPYQGFDSVVDALALHLKRLPEPMVERILPLEIEPLCQIFPALVEIPAIAKNQTVRRAYAEPRERRQRGLSALREMLCRLAHWEPLVLFIDDLQWGDEETAALFCELMQAEQAPQALFIGTFRSEEANSLCLRLIRRSQRTPTEQLQLAEQIELSVDRLEPADAYQLAYDLLSQGGLPQAELAKQVALEAAGDPLFIRVFAEQLIEAFLAGESVSQATAGWTLQDVLWKQVCALDPLARNAIELLSVAGRPLSVNVLESVASGGQSQLGITRALRIQRMIRRLSDHQSVETYHDKIRETVVAQLTSEQQRSHCAALAERLESEGNLMDVEFLADLFSRAGQSIRSGEYYVKAAATAAQQLAFGVAVQYYRRALDQLKLSPAREQELRTSLGDALANDSRSADAAAEYLKAAAIAPESERPRLYQLASLRLLTSGHVDEGLDALKYALRSYNLPWPRTTWHAVVGLLYRVGLLRLCGLQLAKRDVPPSDREQKCREVCWSAERC